MDSELAYRILGLPKSATLEEARAAYRRLAKTLHPDARRTGSAKEFILLSTAFALAKDTIAGNTQGHPQALSATEVLEASRIGERIDVTFERMEREYEKLRARTLGWGKDHIKSVVFGASSGSDLKRAVGTRVLRTWSEMISTLESFVQRVIDGSAREDKDFLYALFKDMYDARRRAWFYSIYRNPFVLGCASVFIGLLLVRHSEEVAKTLPALAALSAHSLSLAAPFALVVVYSAAQLWRLHPRRQFIPPRFSALGVETELRAVAKSIQPDLRESTQGAVLLFAAVGTVMAPGVGTAVGAGVGLVVGLLSGESLSSAKERIYGQLSDEILLGVRQLDSRLLEWMRRQRLETKAAAEESLSTNLRATTAFLLQNRRASRRLIAETKLLPPPGPKPA